MGVLGRAEDGEKERGVVLERGVVVETGAVVEGRVGEGTVVEVGAKVGRGSVIGKVSSWIFLFNFSFPKKDKTNAGKSQRPSFFYFIGFEKKPLLWPFISNFCFISNYRDSPFSYRRLTSTPPALQNRSSLHRPSQFNPPRLHRRIRQQRAPRRAVWSRKYPR